MGEGIKNAFLAEALFFTSTWSHWAVAINAYPQPLMVHMGTAQTGRLQLTLVLKSPGLQRCMETTEEGWLFLLDSNE